MKRALAVSLLLVVVIAPAAIAVITRGSTVPEGAELPIVVDVDGNGLDDLILDDHVLLNQGGEQFVRHHLGLGKGADVVDWLDVNGDGRVDLLTSNLDGYPSSHVLGIPTHRLHIAAGGPLQFKEGIEITPLAGDSNIVIGDLDGDGKEDLVLVKILFEGITDVAAQMTVLRSRGDGTFEKRAPFLMPSHPQWGRYSRRLLIGDLTNDGRRDVVIRTTRELVVLTGTGGGDFTVKSRFLPSPIFGGWETDLGDVDRDGNLDVVTSGMRVVRVLFGDGRGGFNRTAMVFLPQYRYPKAPDNLPHATIDHRAAAPRNLTVGEFITRGRTEIVGATVEGDLFVVAYENGRLREVAPRVTTEFLQPDVFVGSFRHKGSRDLFLTYNLGYGPGYPKPALFHTEPAAAAAIAAPARSSRGRAVGHPAAGPMKLSVEAKDCVRDETIRSIDRDGIWGSYRQGNEYLDAVIDGEGNFHYRYFPKWQPYGVWGTLNPRPSGGWEGTSFTRTPCGDQIVKVIVLDR